MDGKPGIVSNKGEKVGSWPNQLESQCARIDGSDANLSKILRLAFVKIFGAAKDMQFVCEESSELWCENALDRKSKVGRSQRIAV